MSSDEARQRGVVLGSVPPSSQGRRRRPRTVLHGGALGGCDRPCEPEDFLRFR